LTQPLAVMSFDRNGYSTTLAAHYQLYRKP